MDASPNFISDDPRTLTTSPARKVQGRTNSEENTPKSTKYIRRPLEEGERETVAAKRGKVKNECPANPSCHVKKIKCKHIIVKVFKDGEPNLPSPKKSNEKLQEKLQAAMRTKDKNGHLQTKNKGLKGEGFIIWTPQDFAKVPSGEHNSKRKAPSSGSNTSRKKSKMLPVPEIQHGPIESILQEPADSIGDTHLDITNSTSTKDGVFPDMTAGAMTSIVPPNTSSSNQRTSGYTNLSGGMIMYKHHTSPFDDYSVIPEASGSYGNVNATANHFDPQPIPEAQSWTTGQGEDGPFMGYPSQRSDYTAGSEDRADQPLPPSSPDIRFYLEFGIQDLAQSGNFAPYHHGSSPFNDASYQTPSNRNRSPTPSLDFTPQTVESQRRAPATPPGNTPSRTKAAEVRSRRTAEIEEDGYVDMLKGGGEVEGLSGFKNFDDYLLRYGSEDSVHSKSSAQN